MRGRGARKRRTTISPSLFAVLHSRSLRSSGLGCGIRGRCNWASIKSCSELCRPRWLGLIDYGETRAMSWERNERGALVVSRVIIRSGLSRN